MAKRRQSEPLDLMVETARFPSRESRIGWLFEFLRVDLTTLTAGQLLGMRQDALGFASAEGPVIELKPEGGLDETDRLPSVSVLRQLQENLRAGIQKLRNRDSWRLERPVKYGITTIGEYIIRDYPEGAFRDVFMAVMLDVVQEVWPRLNTCPKCGTPFLKSGKQQYCSPACSQQTRWERFKSHRPNRDYHTERDRAVKKRLGNRNVKPGRPIRRRSPK